MRIFVHILSSSVSMLNINQVLERVNLPENDNRFTFLKNKENILFLGYTGSTLYGLRNETSDFDMKCYVLEPYNVNQGLFPFTSYRFIEGSNAINLKDDIDVDFLSLKEFIIRGISGDFVYIEPLFSNNFIYINPLMDLLIQNRKLFLSREVIFRYLGYIKEMTNKLNPKKPEKQDIIDRINKYGYDTKCAMTIFRIKLFIEQILNYGDLNPTLDKEQQFSLLQVKKGCFSKEEVLDAKDRFVKEIKERLDKRDYVIADTVDKERLNDLYVEIKDNFYNLK